MEHLTDEDVRQAVADALVDTLHTYYVTAVNFTGPLSMEVRGLVDDNSLIVFQVDVSNIKQTDALEDQS